MNAHSKVSVPFDPSAISYVTSIGDVRAQHPAAMSRATGKVLSRLDKHCRAMIARSTFVIIGTYGSKGADVSPRGDPAGFVRVLDDRYVLLPDRIGNNRFDSMENIFETGHIGMLFLVPGMAEVLRINGTARIVDDAGLLAGSAMQGRPPRIGCPRGGARGLLALRQGNQSRWFVGSVAARRPQRTAELWRDAGRPLRGAFPGGERPTGHRNGPTRDVLRGLLHPITTFHHRNNLSITITCVNRRTVVESTLLTF